jgi:hemoglobin/transferrin/lactoferrin receptor protein
MHEFSYGIEGDYNDVKSTAFKKNIITGVESPADTRYPDGGSNMTNLGLYLTHLFKMSQYATLTDGMRFSSVTLKATINDTTFFKFPFKEIEQSNLAVNGSIGVIVTPKDDWKITLLGSTGFRAPNVDDLSKIFESVPGNVIVPNSDLKPEYTYNIEMGVSKVFNKMVKVQVTGYYTSLRDAIVTDKFLFNGQDSIIYEGELSAVTANQNKLKAYIYGVNFNFGADITNNFTLAGTVNYTYGRIKTDSTDYPIDHIPPLFGKGSLVYKRDKFKTEFYVLFNGKKSKDDYNLYGEDNFSSATPDGMPAWYTLNLSAAYTINRYLQLEAGVENMLDKNYRVFASGISAPGRNYFVTLKAGY